MSLPPEHPVTKLTIEEVLVMRRLQGKPKSGRNWKMPKARASSINRRQNLVAGSLKDRQERRAELKRTREAIAVLRAERDQEEDRKRAQRKGQQEHRQRMALKGTQVQIVSNTAKLKKLNKKQRQQYMTQAQLMKRLGNQ